MANEEKNLTHNIIMENRKTLSISGVTDVDNFDEKTILLYTQMGELTVQGKGLHVNSVSVETGEMTIEGDIWSLTYGRKTELHRLRYSGNSLNKLWSLKRFLRLPSRHNYSCCRVLWAYPWG